MDLSAFFGGQITGTMMLDFLVRMLISCACGFAIGAERASRFKEAGIRTHVLVAVTSCALMILSKYGFADIIASTKDEWGINNADPARIAAQIVSGVGFLGAGVIFKTGNSIKGLTTAAGIWATAAIGMCIGSGMYYLGLFGTVIIMLLQYIMHRFPYGVDGYSTNVVSITVGPAEKQDRIIQRLMEDLDMKVTETGIHKHPDGNITYNLTVLSSQFITYEDCKKYMEEYPEIMAFDSFPVT
jgi:putative Mg2+ transporter-C (MgtC) family protein